MLKISTMTEPSLRGVSEAISGGPILVAEGDGWRLAGLAAWKRGLVKGTDVLPGRYGEISYGVRLAHYAGWISETMATPADGD